MRFCSKRFIYFLILPFLLLIFLFIVFQLNREGKWSEKADFISRKASLEILYKFTIDFQKEETDLNKLNLYNIYMKEGIPCINDFIITPFDPTLNSKEILEKISDKTNFYKICQYRLIKDDLGWWAITELEYGPQGKYFLMIAKDGEIIKLTEPILPEQKTAKFTAQDVLSKKPVRIFNQNSHNIY